MMLKIHFISPFNVQVVNHIHSYNLWGGNAEGTKTKHLDEQIFPQSIHCGMNHQVRFQEGGEWGRGIGSRRAEGQRESTYLKWWFWWTNFPTKHALSRTRGVNHEVRLQFICRLILLCTHETWFHVGLPVSRIDVGFKVRAQDLAYLAGLCFWYWKKKKY